MNIFKKGAILKSSLKMKKNSRSTKKETRFLYLSKKIDLKYVELKEAQKKENGFRHKEDEDVPQIVQYMENGVTQQRF